MSSCICLLFRIGVFFLKRQLFTASRWNELLYTCNYCKLLLNESLYTCLVIEMNHCLPPSIYCKITHHHSIKRFKSSQNCNSKLLLDSRSVSLFACSKRRKPRCRPLVRVREVLESATRPDNLKQIDPEVTKSQQINHTRSITLNHQYVEPKTV